MDNVVVFSLNSSKELTEKICKKLGIKEGKIEIRHFADGEILVELLETVRDKRVYIIQSTDNPVSQNLMELLIAIDSVKRAFAKRIDVIIPYFGYARQDRKARPRQPITGRLVANLLEAAGATSVMTVEIHSTQTMGFFDIPADDLTVIGILAGYFKKKKILKDIVIVSPDHGGVKRARDIAEIFNAPIAIIDKRRVRPNEAEAMNLIGTVEGSVELKDILPILAERKIKKIELYPFMMVAGDHAHNDMAGDEEDSWFTILKNEGYEVNANLKGLGEYPMIREILYKSLENTINCRRG